MTTGTETKERRVKNYIVDLLISLLMDFIVLGILGKKGQGKMLSSDEAQKIAKTIAPHLFGFGLADEALFSAALAKIEDSTKRNKLFNFLSGLSDYDRSRFILGVTILSSEQERVAVLLMYSELSESEMIEVAKATRMISGSGKSPTYKAKETTKMIYSNFDQAAQRLAEKIKPDIENAGWFTKMAKTLFR